MKKLMIALVSMAAVSCSQNEKPQSTEPADYAETEKKLIQNHIQDSIKGDSIDASTAMPPQNAPEKENR
ncbi:MAG: hypothetical protein L6264_07045 [Weeksellaceae bacterium]|nr:hypothetical protein [Bacteroidota bacterium]MCG2780688.1 hypothetical protein [Weeksellaceae bacterium]